MTVEERLQKVMHRIDSAILHMEAVAKDTADDEVQFIIGHLKRAQEKLHALNFATYHEGKKVVQPNCFSKPEAQKRAINASGKRPTKFILTPKK